MSQGESKISLTITTPDDKVFVFTVDHDETVENVKALIEVETGTSLSAQVLLFKGAPLRNEQKLNECGVQNDDLLVLEVQRAPATAAPQSRAGGEQGIDAAAVQRYFRENPEQLQQLLHNNPSMAEAVLSDDLSLLTSLLQQREAERRRVEMERILRVNALNADPFDVEAQRQIEEAIRMENVKENMEQALEYNPEAFGRVVMLYIDCEVNRTPLKAFVDSGAQMTIMSAECAARCGLGRLMDTRWAGIARGVGTARILGRVHVAPLKIGNSYFSSSFTILDNNQGTDLLLGLDMLRKHQCSIDLKNNCLRIGDEAVSFLSEKDIPESARLDRADDETAVLDPPPSSSTSSSSSSTPTPMSLQPPTTATQPSAPSPSTRGRVPAASQPASNNPFSEALIKQLMELGHSREAVIAALRMFNGNAEMAASYLFSSSFGP
ncbi:DNA damage-inducible protein 1 [Balamuthia mandrillaris]